MRASALALLATTAILLAMVPSFAQRSSAKGDPNRLICRSIVKTGTLAARERTCLTRAQWEQVQAGASKAATDMQERLRGKPCGDPSMPGC